MKRIKAILGGLIIFSMFFTATPVMAEEKCPVSSTQGENVKYVTEENEKADDLKKKSVDKDGRLPSGTMLASVSQCYMHGDALSDRPMLETISTIIDVVLGVLGLVAVIVIILGGVQYTTSAGDPGRVKKAKDTILYGIIGLVVALLAFAIVNFVLSSMMK